MKASGNKLDKWARSDEDAPVAPTQEEALIEIYKRARPGEPPTAEAAANYFNNAYFDDRRYSLSKVGRYKLTKKLSAEIDKIEDLFVSNWNDPRLTRRSSHAQRS